MGWGDPIKNNSEETSVIEKPLPVEQPIVPAVEENTDTFTSATMIPSADDDIEIAEPTQQYDGTISGFDRTKRAWDEWTESLQPIVDENGNNITEEEMESTGKLISNALIETDESGRSKLSPNRRPRPDEIAIAKALESGGATGTKVLLNIAGALTVGGNAVLDVVEDTLEKASQQQVGGAVLEFVAKLSTELRDFGGYGRYKRDTDVEVNPKQWVDAFAQGSVNMLEFSEALPALGAVSTLLSVRSLDTVNQAKEGSKIYNAKLKKLEIARRNNYEGARFATSEAKVEAKAAAAKIANVEVELRNDMILKFEEGLNGRKISTENKDGNLVVDYDLATKEGKKVIREDIKIVETTDGKVAELDPLASVIGTEGGIISPILNPEKLDSLVAVVAEYKNKMKAAGKPDAFNPKNAERISKLKAKKKSGTLSQAETEELKALNKNNKGPMKTLLDITIMKDLEATSELIDILNKYDLSLEEMILSSVGSFSEAGTVLQIARQLNRVRPDSDIDAEKTKKLLAAEAGIANASQRLENVRRGMLVSKFATATRNFESTAARMPMESLMNVFDAVMYSFNEPIKGGIGKDAQGGFLGAAKTLTKKEMWQDSFKAHKYAFSRPDIADGYMRLMLEQPEFSSYYSKMYENINEIQKATGRGVGGKTDETLSLLEDATSLVNTANRWQESVSRNAFAMADLERLVRREYKIDLVDALNEGKLKDLMNDASTVKPKGARSFHALMAEATERALTATYANQPDGKIFKTITQLLTTNKLGGVIPLTVFVEFPRFMFSSLEFIGQSSVGAAAPMLKKAVGLRKDGFSVKEQRAIQRNLVGAAAIGSAYLYRNSENAPEKFDTINVAGKDVDITAQFPIKQFMYIGEALKRFEEGTFDQWFDTKVLAETFLGTAFRTGTGNIWIEELASIADGLDVSGGVKAAEIAGETVSNYIWGYFNFLTQIPDLQRARQTPMPEAFSIATGLYPRPNEYKEDTSKGMAKGPFEAFYRELGRGGKRGGLTISAQEEAALPIRSTVFKSQSTRPDANLKTFLGLAAKDEADENEKFVSRLGIPLWKIGSNSDVASVKDFENKQLSLFIPMVVDTLKAREQEFKMQYWQQSTKAARDKVSIESFINRKSRSMFEALVRTKKATLKATSSAVADRYSAAMIEYNKISKSYRRQSIVDYQLKNNGKSPNLGDITVIRELIINSKLLRKTDTSIATKAAGQRKD